MPLVLLSIFTRSLPDCYNLILVIWVSFRIHFLVLLLSETWCLWNVTGEGRRVVSQEANVGGWFIERQNGNWLEWLYSLISACSYKDKYFVWSPAGHFTSHVSLCELWEMYITHHISLISHPALNGDSQLTQNLNLLVSDNCQQLDHSTQHTHSHGVLHLNIVQRKSEIIWNKYST